MTIGKKVTVSWKSKKYRSTNNDIIDRIWKKQYLF